MGKIARFFKSLKPVKTGKIDSNFSLDKLPAQNNFALVISGQLEVKEDGYYLFMLNSDDGSKFYLSNQLLINHDDLHGDDNIKTYIIPLKKGFYPVREEYFQKDGGAMLNLEYLTPATIETMKSTPIPLALQYGKN
ncbi:PA14 domain-containing protein [Pedobacter sp. NJ-S-72]